MTVCGPIIVVRECGNWWYLRKVGS